MSEELAHKNRNKKALWSIEYLHKYDLLCFGQGSGCAQEGGGSPGGECGDPVGGLAPCCCC